MNEIQKGNRATGMQVSKGNIAFNLGNARGMIIHRSYEVGRTILDVLQFIY